MTEEERLESKRASHRRWKARNREAIRAYERKQYKENPAMRERMKRQASKWVKDHPEAHRESSKRAYRKRAKDPEKRAIMTAMSKRYHDANIEKTREYHRKYGKRNREAIRERKKRTETPEKIAAGTAVVRALKRGELERSFICERCGMSGITEAHHYKGYAEEHQLDVEWLCKSCHMKQTWADKRIPIVG